MARNNGDYAIEVNVIMMVTERLASVHLAKPIEGLENWKFNAC